MTSLFTRLPISVTNAALGQISPSDIEDLSAFESLAYGHWVFDKGDSSAYTDPLRGKVLTEQGAAVTFDGATNANVSWVAGNALLTDKGETAAVRDTVAMVAKFPVLSGVRIPFGTLATTPAEGGSLFLIGSDVYTTYRGITSSESVRSGLLADTWYFVAVTRNFNGATDLRVLIGGDAVFTSAAGAGSTYIPAATDKIALGNARYTVTPTDTFDVAEFMVFDFTMTNAELSALYNRRKAVMAARGITVV